MTVHSNYFVLNFLAEQTKTMVSKPNDFMLTCKEWAQIYVSTLTSDRHVRTAGIIDNAFPLWVNGLKAITICHMLQEESLKTNLLRMHILLQK